MDIIYIAYDIISTPKIVAITDNVYDMLVFVDRHYSQKCKPQKHIDDYYYKFCGDELDIQDIGDYYLGVLIRQKHINYDYIYNEELSSNL